MGLAENRLLRHLYLWFGFSLCILPQARAENSVTWFVRMQHLVVPLRSKVEPEVVSDYMNRTVELTFARLRKSEIRHLVAQVKSGAGKVIWVRNRGRRTRILLRFDFKNMLVLHSVASKPRRFVMDVGTCRYMLPAAPWAEFSKRVQDESSRKILLSSERLLKSGHAQDAVAALEKLAMHSDDSGLMACIRLADIAMLAAQPAKAGLMAETCLHRSRVLNSRVESLAMLRVISYRGYLFSTNLDLQLADLEPEPGSTDWITQEYYYQLARTRYARGEFEKSLSRAVMLSKAFKGSKRAEQISPMAINAMERIVEQGKKVGKYASISEALLDGVRWIHPIPAGRFVRLVRITADALIKAGAPRMAADLLTWYLRSVAGKRVDVGVLKVLSLAFLKIGDSYRAGRTLDFLVAQHPGKNSSADVLEIRAKVLKSEGRQQDATDTLVAALGVATDPVIIKRVAFKVGYLFQGSGDFKRGLELVSGAIEKVEKKKKDSKFFDLLLLQGDLAYSLKNSEVATRAYEAFVRLNPKDSRRQMVLYRLQRLGRNVIEFMDPDDLKDTSVWSKANDVLRQSGLLAGSLP